MNQITTTPKKSFIETMTADTNVGMDEVVAIFLSRYESDLFARRTQLQKDLKQAKLEIDDHIKTVIESVDQEQYGVDIPILGIKFRVSEINVVFTPNADNYNERGYKNEIVLKIGLIEKGSARGEEHNAWIKTLKTPLDKIDIDQHARLMLAKAALESELLEVNSLIKNVNVKERQIKGRIAEQKLTQAGFGDLLNDESMLQLIQLPAPK